MFNNDKMNYNVFTNSKSLKIDIYRVYKKNWTDMNNLLSISQNSYISIQFFMYYLKHDNECFE